MIVSAKCQTFPSLMHFTRRRPRRCGRRRVLLNGDSVVTQQRVPNNPSILNGKYFSVIKEKFTDNSIVGLCQLCLPKKTEIKGQITSSSNFLSHLKRKHFTAFEAYSLEFGRKKQRVPMTHEEAMNIAQNQFETDDARYVIHAMIPLKSVEDKYFRKIFNNLGFGGKINAISRRQLGRTINKMYEEEMSGIKNQLQNIAFVCTTADIWSGKASKFFGGDGTLDFRKLRKEISGSIVPSLCWYTFLQ